VTLDGNKQVQQINFDNATPTRLLRQRRRRPSATEPAAQSGFKCSQQISATIVVKWRYNLRNLQQRPLRSQARSRLAHPDDNKAGDGALIINGSQIMRPALRCWLHAASSISTQTPGRSVTGRSELRASIVGNPANASLESSCGQAQNLKN